MAEEEKRYEVDTIKEIREAKKAKAKGSGITFKPYVEPLEERLKKVEEKRWRIQNVPADERLYQRLRSMGKLTARERINILFDPGTFWERSIFAESMVSIDRKLGYETPAEGIVTGVGKVNGRLVASYATDYTVLAGSAGQGHLIKMHDLMHLAGEMGMPIVSWIDSAGARLTEAAECATFDKCFYYEVVYSGVVPQIAIVCGGCAAGQAYLPGLVDFCIMTRNAGSMWLGGPRAVSGLTGEDITEVGGADYHARYSGECTLAVDDDKAAADAVKQLLSYLPSSYLQAPPYVPSMDDPCRREERLLKILPDDPRRTYDMHEIIDLVVDKGSFFEIFPDWARNVIAGFCRFDGYVVGLIAGNPAYLAGSLEMDACDKLAKHATFCDSFNIPLVYLVDMPALLVGDEWERRGIIRHGCKLLYSTNTATVPRVCVLIRKCYGGTNVFFCRKGTSADVVYCWPNAEMAAMGPDAAVSVIYDRQIKALPTTEERLAFAEQKKKEYFDTQCDCVNLARSMVNNVFDDIIDPRQTREKIIRALEVTRNMRRDGVLPNRRHGNPPV